MARHPEFSKKKTSRLSAERSEAHDIESIRGFFHKWKAAIDKDAIQLGDIYNFDETGFRIGVGRDQVVVTLYPKTRIYRDDPDVRETITSVECVSGDGVVLPPFLITKGKQILTSWLAKDFHPGTKIGVSDTEYTNDVLAMEWIRHFDECTKTRQIRTHRFLPFNGHGSYMTYKFIEY